MKKRYFIIFIIMFFSLSLYYNREIKIEHIEDIKNFDVVFNDMLFENKNISLVKINESPNENINKLLLQSDPSEKIGFCINGVMPTSFFCPQNNKIIGLLFNNNEIGFIYDDVEIFHMNANLEYNKIDFYIYHIRIEKKIKNNMIIISFFEVKQDVISENKLFTIYKEI